MFKDKYGFNVHSATLSFQNDPEQEARRSLCKFVCDEDKDRSLLIVYYAGHGYSKVNESGNIMLTG